MLSDQSSLLSLQIDDTEGDGICEDIIILTSIETLSNCDTWAGIKYVLNERKSMSLLGVLSLLGSITS